MPCMRFSDIANVIFPVWRSENRIETKSDFRHDDMVCQLMLVKYGLTGSDQYPSDRLLKRPKRTEDGRGP